MRYCSVILTVAIVLAVTTAVPTTARPSRSLSGISSKRLLRPDNVTNGGEDDREERAITIPGLSMVKWIKDSITTEISMFTTWYRNRKQAQVWMKEDKTPDEVFKLLKLDEDLNTVLNSPKLTTWTFFLVKYNKRNPRPQTLIETLTKHYRTLPVAKTLEAARLDPNGATFRLADRLQGDQLLGWQQKWLSTDVVFDLLRLGDDSAEKVLSNPAMSVWVYYFTRSNLYNPDREVSMITKLRMTYDDIALAKATEAAMKEKRSTNAIRILQKAQFKAWLLEGKDPPKIFKMLEIETTKWSYDLNVDIYRAYKLFYEENKK